MIANTVVSATAIATLAITFFLNLMLKLLIWLNLYESLTKYNEIIYNNSSKSDFNNNTSNFKSNIFAIYIMYS